MAVTEWAMLVVMSSIMILIFSFLLVTLMISYVFNGEEDETWLL